MPRAVSLGILEPEANTRGEGSAYDELAELLKEELAGELKQEMRIICGAWHLLVLSLVSRLAGPPGGVSPPARLLSCISSVAPLPHRLLRPAMLGGLDDDPSSSSSMPRSEVKDRVGRRCADRAGGDTAFGSTLRKDSAGGACED